MAIGTQLETSIVYVSVLFILMCEYKVLVMVALKVSPQGQLSGINPQSSSSNHQSSGSNLQFSGLILVSPQARGQGLWLL